MSFKKHIIHVLCFWHQMWLSTKAPNVAYVHLLLAVVHQTWAPLAQCAAPSPVHDDVQYTVVIIGGLLHAYHMYHIGIFQGASDDLAEHKASTYLETRYWTPIKAQHVPFFMLLCALISGPITLWIIICPFCRILPWQSAQKAISLSQTCSIHLPPQLSRDLCTCFKAPQVLPHLYHHVFIYIWVKWGTIVISCSLHMGIAMRSQLTSVGLKSTILWFESDALTT